MKKKILLIIISIIFLQLSYKQTFAEDLEGTNYKIVDATINPAGQTAQGTSNYNILTTLGDFSSDPRKTSSSYSMRTGLSETLIANTPKIDCFDITSDGTSSCTSSYSPLPSYIKNNGMVTVCGPTGCYNKGHFEIDTQNNPDDTLYSIQLSTSSNFQSNVYIVDGVTNTIKPLSSRSLSDYKGSINSANAECATTSNCWENDVFNVKGLQPETEYYIRATALHGNFTESEPGPAISKTTSIPILEMDIDIGTTSGHSPTAPPHEVHFEPPPNITATANEVIWINSGTNCSTGFTISQNGEYGGLYKPTGTTHLIPATTGDLDTVSEGVGLQSYTSGISYLYGESGVNGELGQISALAPYNNTGNNVGTIESSTFNNIYNSNGPIYEGETATQVLGKSDSSTITGTYEETITFITIINN